MGSKEFWKSVFSKKFIIFFIIIFTIFLFLLFLYDRYYPRYTVISTDENGKVISTEHLNKEQF